MQIKAATMEDYNIAFDYFEKLWTFNTYDYEETKKVYEKVLADANSFVFFALDDAGNYHGLCHGSYIETFWMTGCTCYVASLITNKDMAFMNIMDLLKIVMDFSLFYSMMQRKA